MNTMDIGCWPDNLLIRIFTQEELLTLKANAPVELEAFLIYTVRDMYPDIDAELILQFFMEGMPQDEIARRYRRQKEFVSEVIMNAGDKLKDPLLLDTYRKGLRWRVEQEKQKAYIAGYRKGYNHAIKGVPANREDHGNAFTDVFFDLPGHNHSVAFLEPSEEIYNAMYFAGIHELKTLLDADDRKLLTEYRLDQNEINKIAELLKNKGYSCNLTRGRNPISISFWPDNLLIAGLTETSAYHLLCYAPVDLRESFEFVRKIALTGNDEEILKLHYDFGFSYQDIADELEIPITEVHERIIKALRKLRDPRFFDLIRYGLKTTVRELIRMESECGFQDGFNRGIEDRWEDVDEETGAMKVPMKLIDRLKSVPVDSLHLSVRVTNCLRSNKVDSVAGVVQLQDQDLLAMNNLGKSALQDIRERQSEYIKNLLVDSVTGEIEMTFTSDTGYAT